MVASLGTNRKHWWHCFPCMTWRSTSTSKRPNSGTGMSRSTAIGSVWHRVLQLTLNARQKSLNLDKAIDGKATKPGLMEDPYWYLEDQMFVWYMDAGGSWVYNLPKYQCGFNGLNAPNKWWVIAEPWGCLETVSISQHTSNVWVNMRDSW